MTNSADSTNVEIVLLKMVLNNEFKENNKITGKTLLFHETRESKKPVLLFILKVVLHINQVYSFALGTSALARPGTTFLAPTGALGVTLSVCPSVRP